MDGILNLLKPSGMTSQQAVAAVRRLLNIKKAGHGGTLDPAAAGVLPVFIGKGTRLSEYALDGDKEYIGQICFGRATDTQDAQGRVIETNDKIITTEAFTEFLKSACGKVQQIPSAYSAVKIDGERAYRLARAGKEVSMAARTVTVYETEFLSAVSENNFLFRVCCSKGTYIRSLCNDWGKALGTFAHLAFLLRTKTGRFEIEDAVSFEKIEKFSKTEAMGDLLMPLVNGAAHLPSIALPNEYMFAVKNGQLISRNIPELENISLGGPYALYLGGEFVAVVTMEEDGLHMSKVFI